jgi:hypothetical protein
MKMKTSEVEELKMTTEEIANRLVEYCRKGDFEGAQKELYAPHAKSIEAYATPDFEKETIGLDAIRKKGNKFDKLTEQIHSLEVSEPLVAEHTIVFKSPELCLYRVENGKIVSEEFFV